MADTLCGSLLGKIHEQVERTGHLINLLPADRMDSTTLVPGWWDTGRLLGHLLECLAGFCAVLYGAEPDRLAHFRELRSLPVNHPCGRDEARERMEVYRIHIDEGFGLLRDADLGRVLPTVFTPQGETLLTLLLGNLEHLINHKHQLFTCLKLMGVDVGSRDLYRFRE
jgi:hypothetical protein